MLAYPHPVHTVQPPDLAADCRVSGREGQGPPASPAVQCAMSVHGFSSDSSGGHGWSGERWQHTEVKEGGDRGREGGKEGKEGMEGGYLC